MGKGDTGKLDVTMLWDDDEILRAGVAVIMEIET